RRRPEPPAPDPDGAHRPAGGRGRGRAVPGQPRGRLGHRPGGRRHRRLRAVARAPILNIGRASAWSRDATHPPAARARLALALPRVRRRPDLRRLVSEPFRLSGLRLAPGARGWLLPRRDAAQRARRRADLRRRLRRHARAHLAEPALAAAHHRLDGSRGAVPAVALPVLPHRLAGARPARPPARAPRVLRRPRRSPPPALTRGAAHCLTVPGPPARPPPPPRAGPAGTRGRRPSR